MARKKATAKRKKGVSQHRKSAHQKAFLAAYSSAASIQKAATAAGVDRSQHYLWMEEPAYAEKFGAIQSQAGQVLEDEAIRRAHEGIEEPYVFEGSFAYPKLPVLDPETGEQLKDENGKLQWKQGTEPITVRKFSDGLLQFLLRGFKPEKYRDRTSVEVSGSIDIVDRLNAARKRLQKT